MAENYASRYTRNALAGVLPGMRQQQEAQRKYIMGTAQRIGAKGAVQNARKVADAYAEQAGSAAAKIGAEAEKMGQQEEHFQQQQKNWEKTFAQNQKIQDLNMQLAKYKATGVLTPELMDAFGLSDVSSSDIRARDRQLDLLGIQPNASGTGTSTAPWASGPFGANNRTLYERAMRPGYQFANKARDNQIAWLRNQFG